MLRSNRPSRRHALTAAPLIVAATLLSGCALSRQQSGGYVAQAKQMWRRGVSALESGEADEAETWLRKAAEATPDDGTTQQHLAEALWQTGKHDEAIRYAEQACRSTPSSCEAVIRAGEMCLSSGATSRASQWGDRAIEIDARSPTAWSLRGRAHMKLGETEQALADFQQALRYAPNDPRLLSDVALLHRARGDHRRCLTALHQLLDAYPPGQEPAGTLAMVGESYLNLGRPRDATDALRLATSRGPADANLLYRLAEAQAACGNNRMAVADAKRALSVDAQHEGCRALIARLESSGGTSLH